jgi:hypothetical protein
VGNHHLTLQFCTPEIEARLVWRRGGLTLEAVRLGGDHVEPGRAVGGVETSQESGFVEIQRASFQGRRQSGGKNQRVFVGSSKIDGSLAQQTRVGRGIYKLAAPV